MRLAVVLLGGMVFGVGLALAGMTRMEVVLDFLRLDDLGLLLVMGGGIAVAGTLFAVAPRARHCPPLGDAYEAWTERLDARTIGGAVLFGLGWGISGVCPGAAIASLGTGNAPVLLAIVGILAGAFVQGRFLPERPPKS